MTRGASGAARDRREQVGQPARVRFATVSYPAALAAITLAAALFRLAFLAWQPLGTDEDFTAVVARMPLDRMLAALSHDSAPPLSYLLDASVAWLGPDPWLLRIPAALAGTALVPLVAALARRIGGDRAALWAAAYTAVLPSAVLASRDARMYALGAAFTTAALLALWRASERPSTARWAAFAALAAAAVWTVYFAGVAVVAMLAAWLWFARPARRSVIAALAAAGLAAISVIPWLAFARDQLSHSGGGFWVEPLGPRSIGGVAMQFFTGPPVLDGVPGLYALWALQGLAVAAGATALAIAAFATVRVFYPDERRAVTFVAAVPLGGLALLAAASLVRSVFEARYASVLWAPLFAVAGAGLAFVPRRAWAAAILVALAVPSLALTVAIRNPETAALLPGVEARVGAHDLVAASPNQFLDVLAQSGPRVRDRLRVVGAPLPWYFGTAAYPRGAVIPAVPADVVSNAGAVFYLGLPEDGVPPLPAGYAAAEQTCRVRVCLTVYEPRR